MLDQVSLSIQLDATVHASGDQWVANCPSLDVATQAESSEGALSALKEAVEGWFESCLDRGVVQEALIECGFERLPSLGGRAAHTARDGAIHTTIECSVPAYVMAALEPSHAPG